MGVDSLRFLPEKLRQLGRHCRTHRGKSEFLPNLLWRFLDRQMWAAKEDEKASSVWTKYPGGCIVDLADSASVDSHENVSVWGSYPDKSHSG